MVLKMKALDFVTDLVVKKQEPFKHKNNYSIYSTISELVALITNLLHCNSMEIKQTKTRGESWT